MRAPRGRARNAVSACAVGAAGVAQRVDDHQRPLAFEQVAVDLLAVVRAGFEVQQIVLDLEGGAEKEARAGPADRAAGGRARRSGSRRAADEWRRASRSSAAPSAGSPRRSRRCGCRAATPVRAPGLRCSPTPCARSPRRCAAPVARPRRWKLSLSGRRLSSPMASPAFSASGMPCSACSVGVPRRSSLASSMSSWTSSALCISSIDAAEAMASSVRRAQSRAPSRCRGSIAASCRRAAGSRPPVRRDTSGGSSSAADSAAGSAGSARRIRRASPARAAHRSR